MDRFALNAAPIKMCLALEDPDALKMHEEVIHESLNELASQIERDGHLKNPIIVDEKTMTVLDGNHRFFALKEVLKVRYVPICAVDYDSPLISIGTWYRVVDVPEAELSNVVEEMLALFDLKEVGLEDVDDLLASKSASFCVLLKDQAFARLVELSSVLEAYLEVKSFEAMLEARGYRLQYFSEKRGVAGKSNLSKSSIVLVPPVITKEDVREVAGQGRLYPPKSTRHIIPFRPLLLNVPLSLLRTPASKSEANRMLCEYLSQGTFERKPPRTKVEERTYAEEVLLFRRQVLGS